MAPGAPLEETVVAVGGAVVVGETVVTIVTLGGAEELVLVVRAVVKSSV